jgi:ABC-type phosphate transport system substrate-binding protein
MHLRSAMPLALALLTACGGGAGTAATAEATTPQRRDANVISEEELRAVTSSSVYDAIRRLRPAWRLQPLPTTALLGQSEGQLMVYVDGARFGNAESLRQMQPSGVLSIRFYSPSEAEARFGPGHLKGAIEVVTGHR